MQRRVLALSVVVVGLGVWLLTPMGVAQTAKTKAKKKEEFKAIEADTPIETSGRLPNNWRKLELTEAQKNKIYDLQLATKKKIEALELQIDGLRSNLQGEMMGVLTAQQKQQLATLDKETKASSNSQ